MIKNNKTKIVLRIVLCAVAVLGAVIVVCASAGIFDFWKNGYDEYFNRKRYDRRQFIFDTEYILETDGNLTFSSPSPFAPEKIVVRDALVSFNKTAKEIVITIENKGSFKGSAVFSCVTPRKSGVISDGQDTDGKIATKVFAYSGEEEIECKLQKCEFTKKQSTYVFKAQTVKNVDKIKVAGFMITEFKRK